MKEQCEAVTQASTYSEAHRCLKKGTAAKAGRRILCAHHRTADPKV